MPTSQGTTGPNVTLSLIQADAAHALLDFEVANRGYFESRINARPPGYYSRDGVRLAIEAALRDMQDDMGYQYLVWDSRGTLVGRVNLSKVRRAHYFSAELGYRVAANAAGQGIASTAVRQVTVLAAEQHALIRLESIVRPDNTASLRVLDRNGFTPFGRSTSSFELHGQWHDLIHLERRLSTPLSGVNVPETPLPAGPC